MGTVTTQSTGQRSPGELSEILALLLARQVPLIHSARLLCDVAGIGFKQVADAAGIGRGHLYKMLRGIRPVSASARQAFVDCLGLDPWALSATASTGAVEQNERLRTALERLLNSDPTGSIATATDDELREAVGDEATDSIVRQQAAAVLLAREVLHPTMLTAQH